MGWSPLKGSGRKGRLSGDADLTLLLPELEWPLIILIWAYRARWSNQQTDQPVYVPTQERLTSALVSSAALSITVNSVVSSQPLQQVR